MRNWRNEVNKNAARFAVPVPSIPFSEEMIPFIFSKNFISKEFSPLKEFKISVEWDLCGSSRVWPAVYFYLDKSMKIHRFAHCSTIAFRAAFVGVFIFSMASVLCAVHFTCPTPSEVTRIPASEQDIFEDWLLQDLAYDPAVGQGTAAPDSAVRTVFTDKAPGSSAAETERRLIEKVLSDIQKILDNSTAEIEAVRKEEVAGKIDRFRKQTAELNGVPGTDARWRELYRQAASVRRELRLAPMKKLVPSFILMKHPNLGGSHYAYTEAVSDAQAERSFRPGSQICLLELDSNGNYVEKQLVNDPYGMIRDPEMTYDGKNLVFAWKKSDRLDDFHIYRMNLDSKEITQLTFGLGWADYEPCCLPSGDIIFNSTRCSQIVDCWWTEVSNLYRMDADGNFMRRMSFDQVHDNYPTLTLDGRVIYTRWDYNDRGQIFPQGLFQMNPDGTGQTALYGNNSWFPTTILHARPIPNTNGKILCIFSGHHTRQRGKLGVLDPNKGREEADGATLAAPVRETKPERIDAYGQSGEQFCYPMPITETEFLTAYRPNAEAANNRQGDMDPFSIYFMNLNGERELLVSEAGKSCLQTIFKQAKPPVLERPSAVDPTQDSGVYYLQDVFYGPGLEGVDRNSVRSLRVVAIGYRSVGIGSNGNGGPAGGAMVSTPIAIGHGAWDPKKVLGEAKIYSDGSACFRAPAKTPLYFQVIDVNGHVVQTMRSWSTLQPGETFSCIGCHEDKNSIAARGSSSEAMKAGPQDLAPFYGPARWFSFTKEIQPILDKHCVRCHDNSEAKPPYTGFGLGKMSIPLENFNAIFDIENSWSYSFEKPSDGWTTRFPIHEGAKTAKGPFGGIPGLKKYGTAWRTGNIWMTSELTLPENYAPSTLYGRIFYDEDVEVYVNGQNVFSATGYLTNYEMYSLETNPLKPGRNIIAVHCLHGSGGQGVDAGLYEMKKEAVAAGLDKIKPFSLLGRPFEDTSAKRFWSESYLNLTNAPFEAHSLARRNKVANWINIQNSPEMLKPYDAGAAKSSLCSMFNGPAPHNGVQLSQKEKDLLACWLDLLVPFCDSYEDANAWNEAEHAKNARYGEKKRWSDERDAQNYAAWAKNLPYEQAHSPEEIQREQAVKEKAYRNWISEARKELAEDKTTFTFPKAIQTDQIQILLKNDVSSEQKFNIALDGVSENVSVRPEARVGIMSFSQRTCSKVTIIGNIETLEKIEILGIPE